MLSLLLAAAVSTPPPTPPKGWQVRVSMANWNAAPARCTFTFETGEVRVEKIPADRELVIPRFAVLRNPEATKVDCTQPVKVTFHHTPYVEPPPTAARTHTRPKGVRDPFISSFKAAPFTEPMNGLVYMRNRWFDPRTGTFLTPDPMGYRDSTNPYAYGGGDPVNNSDPTGLALYAFDGTWNDRDEMPNDTNVAKLARAYRDGLPIYRKGVGTNWYTKYWGGFAGMGGRNRVEGMYRDLTEVYNAGDEKIDIIGFSRGAALALSFANEIYQHGIYSEKIHNRVYPLVRFVGLFDTVGSFGMPGNNLNLGHTLTLPPNVLNARHVIAANEYRRGFPLTRIANPRCGQRRGVVEMAFRGAHADVGGGYEDNDNLSRHPLQWMWGEMIDVGIRMAPIPFEVGAIAPGAEVKQHHSHRSVKYLPDWMGVALAEAVGVEPIRTVFLPPCQ